MVSGCEACSYISKIKFLSTSVAACTDYYSQRINLVFLWSCIAGQLLILIMPHVLEYYYNYIFLYTYSVAILTLHQSKYTYLGQGHKLEKN